MKFGKTTYDELRSKFGAWSRERKARAEERKHAKQMAALRDQHAHSRFWLLNVPALATICAAVVEWYWAVLFCIEATGQIGMDWSTSTGSDAPASGAWHFLFDIQNVAVLVGLILATMPIVMLSMIWLPVQFAMRGAGRWRRGSLIAVGLLANVLVIVSGTVVMNYNRQDQVREALVVEQTADAQRAMLVANVDDLRAELDTLMNHRSTYVATAASVGAQAYERDYVTQARTTNDPRLPLLERALGSARRADDLRAQIRAARAAVASAAPTAASQANVEDNVGRELNTFAQYVEVWRPPFVAFICTLIGIFGAWWTLAMLERLNPKDVLRSGWADDGHRIEDLRAEEPVKAQPMRPAREVVTDAETGEELVKVRPREYWRKRKGKPQRVQFDPEIPPDETGVEVDGANRQAVSVEERPEHAVSAGANAERGEDHGESALNPVAVAEREQTSPNAEPAKDGEQRQEQPEPPSEEPSTDDLIALHALADDLPVADVGVPLATEVGVETIPEDGDGGDGRQDRDPERPEDNDSYDADGHADEEQRVDAGLDDVAHTEPPAEERQPETDPTRLIAAE